MRAAGLPCPHLRPFPALQSHRSGDFTFQSPAEIRCSKLQNEPNLRKELPEWNYSGLGGVHNNKPALNDPWKSGAENVKVNRGYPRGGHFN